MKKILLSIILASVLLSVLVFAGVIMPPEGDTDNDGVPDDFDLCQDTAEGSIVDANGCAISQLCSPESNYKNHGQYVSCVAQVSEDFLLAGLITQEQKDAIVSEAAQSNIGK